MAPKSSPPAPTVPKMPPPWTKGDERLPDTKPARSQKAIGSKGYGKGAGSSRTEDGCGPSGHSAQSGNPLEEWLVSLDPSGSLVKYLPKLSKEFASLSEVAAALTQRPQGNTSVLKCVEPTFFEALGVVSLGHRLLLAKGVAALSDAL